MTRKQLARIEDRARWVAYAVIVIAPLMSLVAVFG